MLGSQKRSFKRIVGTSYHLPHKITPLKKEKTNKKQNKPPILLRKVGFGMNWRVSAFQLSVTSHPQGVVALLA